ncbi:FAD-dependent oxidoreductase [Georgenia sp. Z1344]|uniref:glycerol-3-phosphate dehydrogenase/oxidase n=1 Tax=Georgenia sp. Z1344 TaxID=3416706 RepID=UPI003CEC23E8
MNTTALTQESRQDALDTMAETELDVLVIGGGVTGAGIALDAATRGLSTGIVEMRDWASGTSQWSSKLIHGGLRYLYQLNFALVSEALKERGILLTTTAPHLVSAQPFLWPLKQRVIERGYSAVGVGMYDALSILGNKGATVPMQKHYSHKGAMDLVPSLDPDTLIGGIRFYDARVDDARLVMTLVRTAQGYGAHAATRSQVTSITTDATGRATGAIVKDLETGREITVRAKNVIGATGVWTEETETLGGAEGGLQVLASKGIHIVVPKERIEGSTGVFLRTEKSVLFIIPWQRYWVIGTTDTKWTEQVDSPVATAEDIDYVLEQANSVLLDKLTRDDIIGTYAGLRPLLQPVDKGDGESTKVSREHTVTTPQPGLTVIAGGKLTSYRLMAQDAVDHAIGKARAKATPSITERTPLVGAPGLEATRRQLPRLASKYNLTRARAEHLVSRYGSEVTEVLSTVDADPSLGAPLEHAPDYLRAEVAYGVTHEGALHLEDMLLHRVRLDFELPDRGKAAAPEVAEVMGSLLGWDDARREQEVQSWVAQADAILAAQQTDNDEAASAARVQAPQLVPVEDLSSAH